MGESGCSKSCLKCSGFSHFLNIDNCQSDTSLGVNGLMVCSFVIICGKIAISQWPMLSDFSGTVNIHPSLLPLYRGAAPVQRALQVLLFI